MNRLFEEPLYSKLRPWFLGMLFLTFIFSSVGVVRSYFQPTRAYIEHQDAYLQQAIDDNRRYNQAVMELAQENRRYNHESRDMIEENTRAVRQLQEAIGKK